MVFMRISTMKSFLKNYKLTLISLFILASLIVAQGIRGNKVVTFPIVSSSSQMNADYMLGPALLINGGGIWHAQRPPRYPEWVEIAYPNPVRITCVGICSQDTGPSRNEHTRAPKDFIFQGSNDRSNWIDLLKVYNNIYTQGGQWKKWYFENDKAYFYYRFHITSSNNPEFLTIRQISLAKPKYLDIFKAFSQRK